VADNKIFCVTSYTSIGGTFLDWSIHWLSGSDRFYNTKSGWEPLTDSPVTSTNSHNHNKNHPTGYESTVKCVQELKKVSTDSLLSFYPFQLETYIATNMLNISIDTLGDRWNSVCDFISKDYAKIWNYCHTEKIPLIYLQLTYPITYRNEYRALGKRLLSGTSVNSIAQSRDDFFLTFFPNDYKIWKEQMPSNYLWDYREFMALNIRPWEWDNSNLNLEQHIDFSLPHLYLDAQELWYNGEQTLIKVMKFLNIPIDNDRLASWLPIYKSWQAMQLNLLKFHWNFDHICDSIVHGYDYDLSGYDLDLWKEACIQHAIIYKYGLNFKTWQLEKFPNNTKELHTLLEKNIHPIEDIYGLLKENK
jgi:hypothetical protein